jgi:hypothetical protein
MPFRGTATPRAGRARYAIGALFAVVAFFAIATDALAKTPHVNIVSQSGPPPGPIPANTSYYTTIQAAVNATRRNYGDWVLVEPGVYHEEVLVTGAHSGIYIRGMNRNTVILDGKHEPKPGGSNGILVEQANNVWIENLTARNFDRANEKGEGDPAGGGGNEIWWTGQKQGESDEQSGQNKARGWWGSYLTAYDDGLNGGYGIFAQHTHEGSWENIYASGFNDSGIYIGACWECKARVSKATMEYNAVGYSGSNSGGRLVIEKSVFRQNSAGIVPNGENPGDGPPPQNGKCNAHRPHSPYVKFSSTSIERCTVFKENLVTENNNLEVPANHSTEKAPWGVGVELPGDAADLVENNVITKNVNNGVLGFEYPNPFPPEEGCTQELEEKGACTRTIYFQLTGNKIANNTFEENGTSGAEFASDITLQGGIFPYHQHTSNNNCVSGNSLTGATFPANIEGTWGCQNTTTPPPNNGLAAIGYLVILSEQSALLRKPVGQPVPPPQETMPEPCKGVPSNPLCP